MLFATYGHQSLKIRHTDISGVPFDRVMIGNLSQNICRQGHGHGLFGRFRLNHRVAPIARALTLRTTTAFENDGVVDIERIQTSVHGAFDGRAQVLPFAVDGLPRRHVVSI